MISIHYHFLFLRKQKMSWYHNYFKMTKVLDVEMVQWLKVPKNLNSVYGIHNAKGECVLSVILRLNMNSTPHLQIQHRKRIYYYHLCSVLLFYHNFSRCDILSLLLFPDTLYILDDSLLIMLSMYFWMKKKIILPLEQT